MQWCSHLGNCNTSSPTPQNTLIYLFKDNYKWVADIGLCTFHRLQEHIRGGGQLETRNCNWKLELCITGNHNCTGYSFKILYYVSCILEISLLYYDNLCSTFFASVELQKICTSEILLYLYHTSYSVLFPYYAFSSRVLVRKNP